MPKGVERCHANDLCLFAGYGVARWGLPFEEPPRHAKCSLGRAAMHAIVFGAKRAFHGALRLTRKPLCSMGLTAARFDLLSALLSYDKIEQSCGVQMHQSKLRRVLGVSGSVVSRMLHSLELLGLVRRGRPQCGDRRQREVSLTERGRVCIREARQALMRAVGRLVCMAICFGQHHDPDRRLVHLDTLEGYLSALRRDFGDSATLYYPYGHPDD